MPDMSRWEADDPGVSPEWWRDRKHNFPMRARKAFEDFHDKLWVYRNQQSEQHLYEVKQAVLSLIASINEVSDFHLKIARVRVGVAHKYPNLRLALQNFLDVLTPHVTPDVYRDV